MQKQKSVLLFLILLGTIYFVAFWFPNSTGAQDFNMTFVFEQDEPAQYPHVIRRLEVRDTLSQTLYKIFAYQHYYFGFPYYGYSALVLLPVKLITNSLENVSLNMLLLRQFVNVLPMIVGMLFLTYLQTRFTSYWKSGFLFLFLLAVPGVVFNNLWIHPDSLVFLFIILTFFYLDKDDLQFGKNFYLAAFACGLAVATKLIGLFFFLAIPYYLYTGWKQNKIDTRRMLMLATSFVVIMFGTFIITNPFLYWESEREFAWKTQTKLQESLRSGFIVAYFNNPLSLLPVFQKWYGISIFLLFSIISMFIGAFRSERKMLHQLIAWWAIPFTLYIAFALVVRAKHFPIPILVPVFSTIFAYFTFFAPEKIFSPLGEYLKKNARNVIMTVIGIVIVVAQSAFMLKTDVALYQENLYREEHSPSIQFYEHVEEKYLSKIVLSKQLVIFRDVYVYVPNDPRFEDHFKWGVSDYEIALKNNPDLLLMHKQHLYDYTQEGQLETAVDPDFAFTVQFYNDVLNDNVEGFTLLYQDDFAIAYIRTELYEEFIK